MKFLKALGNTLYCSGGEYINVCPVLGKVPELKSDYTADFKGNMDSPTGLSLLLTETSDKPKNIRVLTNVYFNSMFQEVVATDIEKFDSRHTDMSERIPISKVMGSERFLYARQSEFELGLLHVIEDDMYVMLLVRNERSSILEVRTAAKFGYDMAGVVAYASAWNDKFNAGLDPDTELDSYPVRVDFYYTNCFKILAFGHVVYDTSEGIILASIGYSLIDARINNVIKSIGKLNEQ